MAPTVLAASAAHLQPTAPYLVSLSLLNVLQETDSPEMSQAGVE
jgi:hypothetical protein